MRRKSFLTAVFLGCCLVISSGGGASLSGGGVWLRTDTSINTEPECRQHGSLACVEWCEILLGEPTPTGTLCCQNLEGSTVLGDCEEFLVTM